MSVTESVSKPHLKEETAVELNKEEREKGLLTEEVVVKKAKKTKEKAEQIRANVTVDEKKESHIEVTEVKSEKKEVKVKEQIQQKQDAVPKISKVVEESSEEEIEYPLPVLETKPQPTTVKEGEPIRLTYKLASESEEAEVQWSKNGQILTQKSDDRLRFGFDSKTGVHYLEVVEAEFDDIGEYTLNAENEGGIIACTVSVNVVTKVERKPPRLEEYPRPQIVKEGSSIQLACKVSG